MNDDKNTASEPGIHYDMPFEDYLLIPAISQSGLKKIMISGHYYRHSVDDDSPAMQMGRLVHTAVLEPDEMDRRYHVSDCARRGTKEWVAQEEAAAKSGAELIKRGDFEEAINLARIVRTHPDAADLLQDICAEVSLIWIDPATGVRCKARLDGLDERRGIIVELKSIQDLKPGTLSRGIANNGYHIQQAFYADGATACGLMIRQYRFIFVSKADGDVAVVSLSINARDKGRELYQNAMIKYSDYRKRDYWPGVCPSGILEVDLPAWAYQKLDSGGL